MQPLLLTLDEGYLLMAAPPDLERKSALVCAYTFPAEIITISTLLSHKAASMAGSLTLGLLVGVDSQ